MFLGHNYKGFFLDFESIDLTMMGVRVYFSSSVINFSTKNLITVINYKTFSERSMVLVGR